MQFIPLAVDVITDIIERCYEQQMQFILLILTDGTSFPCKIPLPNYSYINGKIVPDTHYSGIDCLCVCGSESSILSIPFLHISGIFPFSFLQETKAVPIGLEKSTSLLPIAEIIQDISSIQARINSFKNNMPVSSSERCFFHTIGSSAARPLTPIPLYIDFDIISWLNLPEFDAEVLSTYSPDLQNLLFFLLSKSNAAKSHSAEFFTIDEIFRWHPTPFYECDSIWGMTLHQINLDASDIYSLQLPNDVNLRIKRDYCVIPTFAWASINGRFRIVGLVRKSREYQCCASLPEVSVIAILCEPSC